MAIAEACQVWIEQRVKEELADKEKTGKSLRSIGRGIAKEIEKYFKVEVKPETIFQKARRMEGDTNVSPDTTSQNNSENGINQTNSQKSNEPPKVAKDGTMRGGRRENAGRPIKKHETHKTSEVSDAMRFAWMAISQLERIRNDDPHKQEALEFVMEWVQKEKGRAK